MPDFTITEWLILGSFGSALVTGLAFVAMAAYYSGSDHK